MLDATVDPQRIPFSRKDGYHGTNYRSPIENSTGMPRGDEGNWGGSNPLDPGRIDRGTFISVCVWAACGYRVRNPDYVLVELGIVLRTGNPCTTRSPSRPPNDSVTGSHSALTDSTSVSSKPSLAMTSMVLR